MNGHSCKDQLNLLREYLDGELTAEMKAKLDAHFGGCTPCEEFLKSYRATPSLCRKALAKKMPQSVADKLTSFLREEMKKPA
ncbi:MAG: anti-sigma factor family protein [Archangium sp.]